MIPAEHVYYLPTTNGRFNYFQWHILIHCKA